MGPITPYAIALISLASLAYGKNCLKRNTNALDKLTNSCPGPLDPPSKSYCCLSLTGEEDYCCDAEEFALKNGLGIVVPVVIAVVVIISLIGVLISCLCCKRCPWYRRRHSG